MTLSEILATLTPPEMSAIMSAFESGETYYAEYSPGLFVGVNTDAVPFLATTQNAGEFRLGTITRTPHEKRPATRSLRIH